MSGEGRSRQAGKTRDSYRCGLGFVCIWGRNETAVGVPRYEKAPAVDMYQGAYLRYSRESRPGCVCRTSPPATGCGAGPTGLGSPVNAGHGSQTRRHTRHGMGPGAKKGSG